jgi:hypothetical protein
MTIKLNLSEMVHMTEVSHYNFNFYSFGNMGIKLLQICNEDYNTCDYYLIDHDQQVFLGSADGDTEEDIEFMFKYT